MDATATRNWHRIGIGSFFVMHGLCYASFTSRIVTIQQNLDLSEPQLGALLFALPFGFVFSLFVVNTLIAKFGSKQLLRFTMLGCALVLLSIGYATSPAQIGVALFLLGLTLNTCNVCQNTLGVAWQDLYKTNTLGTFHGLWSVAALSAAGIGTLMIGAGVSPLKHFIIMSSLMVVILAFVGFRFLPTVEQESGKKSAPPLAIPNRALLNLSIISFCCALCEGGMFDWTGVYFKKVVMAEAAFIGVGTTVFMGFEAFTRFIADRLTMRFGSRKLIQGSGLLCAAGLAIVVLFPHLIPATIGLIMAGAGVASVTPTVYGAAAKSPDTQVSAGIAALTGVNMCAYLVAPPLIGFVAGAANLRVSFAIVAAVVLLFAYMAGRTKQLS